MVEEKNVSPDGQNPNPDGEGTGQPKVYDEKAYKEVVTESIQRRKKIDELEAKLKAFEEEKLSEAEKKELKIKEYEAQLAELSKRAKEKEIDNLILKSVVGKNFVDIDTVSLLIKKELEAEEEINDKTVGKVVDNLIKSKPFLVASTSANPSDGNFPKNKQENKTANQMLAEILRGKK